MINARVGIILFDGVCNFCNDSVNLIIKHDSQNYFRFAPLQSPLAKELLAKYGLNADELDTIILIEDEAAFTKSTAALKIARHLDGVWKVFYALIIIPRFLRDAGYDLFAKYRYRLFGKKDTCMIPTPEVREKFLET